MSISSVHRNRVIYQSEALFVSPDATGYHYTGIGGYGLSTPPMSNVDPGQGTFPDGKIHGWHPKTHGLAQWPEWNPSGPSYGQCNEEATFALFTGEVESENAETRVELSTDDVTDGDGNGAQGDITLTQAAGTVADPLKTISQLIQDHNTAAGVNARNDLAIGIPDVANGRAMILPANAVLTLQGGRAALPLDGTVTLEDVNGNAVVIPITAQVAGVWDRNANLVFNGVDNIFDLINTYNVNSVAAGSNSLIDVTPFENAPGVANALGLTVFPNGSSLIFDQNGLSGSDNAGLAPVAVVAVNFQPGDDGAISTFLDTNTVVTNLKEWIELGADVAGSAGNALIVGNGNDNLDTLVSNYNTTHAASPEKQISVVTTNYPMLDSSFGRPVSGSNGRRNRSSGM